MKRLTYLILLLLSISLAAQDSVDVTFYYRPQNNPSVVHIPGEFNGWNPSSAVSEMSYSSVNDVWYKSVRLRVGGPDPLPGANSVPGAYQYKFHDGTWFPDPLNPHNNPQDNNNSYLPINDPTIHLLLPNSTIGVGTIHSRHPEITAFLFPSTMTEIDTSSIILTIGGVTYENIGSAYDPETHEFSFVVPNALGDGEQTVSLYAATVNGDSYTEITSFTVQADIIQFLTLPAQTWKDSWRIKTAIYSQDGGLNGDISSVTLTSNWDSWSVSVSDGIMDTTIELAEGDNTFQVQAEVDGSTEVSNSLNIQKLVDHQPIAKVTIIDVGSLLLLSTDGSQDPDGGPLSYSWGEDTRNPASLGIEGSTSSQENISQPTTPGEYFVSLLVEDDDGELDSTIATFFVEADGETVNIGHLNSNSQWVKNSRVYTLFFKAFTPEGTIASAIPNLDYIAAMGFNTIWVLPVMEIPGDVDNQINIGYYIEDFMHVETSYGTDQDYKDFVAAAHEQGLKVIQDVTPNHSGNVHSFAQEATVYGDASQYWNYYQTEYIPHNTNGLGDCYTAEGIYYYCAFSDVLLNWDWRDLDARRYMTGVYEYWMEEFGIDGYRYDVYWGPSRKYGESNMGVPVRKALKRIKPDILLLGEDDGTGAGTEAIYADQGGGLDASYDFKTYFNSIRSFGFSSANVTSLHNDLDNGGFYPGENSYYLRFLESQDEDRISYVYDSFEKTMPMASVIMTAPGIPMVLNGQEVGWGRGMGQPGEPDLNDRRRGIIDWDFGGHDLLTPHYQKITQIRAQFPAFWQHKKDTNNDGSVDASDESDFDRVQTGDGIVYAFLRPFINSNGLTITNFHSTSESVTLDLAAENLKFEAGFNADSSYWVNNHYSGTSTTQSGTELQNFSVTLPAYGTAIFTISDQEEMVVIPEIPALVSVDEPEVIQANNVRLYPNYPNPFNPSTTIRFDIPEQTVATLKIYDIRGRMVWSGFDSDVMSAGRHELQWGGSTSEGTALSGGLYFVELSTPQFHEVQKLMLLK